MCCVMCEGSFISQDEIVSQLTCPKHTGSFVFSLLPPNSTTTFSPTWNVFSFEMQRPLANYSAVRVTAIDSAGNTVYQAAIEKSREMQTPCMIRLQQHLIKPRNMTYSSKLLLSFQVVSCDDFTFPLSVVEGEVEPLTLTIPEDGGLNEKDILSHSFLWR